jgi:manganese/iron transport system ATP-binding protein
VLALAGPNGAGKSTLLRGVLGLVETSGEVRVLGEEPKRARARCAYVPQAGGMDPHFPITALGVVLTGIGKRTGPPLWPRTRDRALARDALRGVGLEDRERRMFGELSGGQQQRVLLARALAARPEVLLLDEPFNGVDRPSAEFIEAGLVELAERGGAVLVSTHDHEFACRACTSALLLNHTQWGFGPAREVLAPQSLVDCYTGLTSAPVADRGGV